MASQIRGHTKCVFSVRMTQRLLLEIGQHCSITVISVDVLEFFLELLQCIAKQYFKSQSSWILGCQTDGFTFLLFIVTSLSMYWQQELSVKIWQCCINSTVHVDQKEVELQWEEESYTFMEHITKFKHI
jgi:hypothetical protein